MPNNKYIHLQLCILVNDIIQISMFVHIIIINIAPNRGLQSTNVKANWRLSFIINMRKLIKFDQ